MTRDFVEHTTTFDDGRVHRTFVEHGTFVSVPVEDLCLPSYTGGFTETNEFTQMARP